MRSLYEVLNDSKLIIETIQQFGFTDDVKVHCGDKITQAENIITLCLVISHDKEKTSIPWDRTVLLQAKLIEKLACQVTLVHIQACSEPTAYGILSISAPITDEAKICELFKVKSTKAIFLDDTEKARPRIINDANEYIVKASVDVAENLGRHSMLSEAAEREQKKHKPGSSESDSPNQGSTESPKKSNGPGSKMQ